MRWTPGEESEDIEDRRGEADGGGGGDYEGGGGGGGGFPVRLGLGGTVVVLVLSLAFGRNFFALIPGGGGGGVRPSDSSGPRGPREPDRLPPSRTHASPGAHEGATEPGHAEPGAPGGEDHLVQFVSFVLDDIQNTWTRELPKNGAPYHHAKLVLFRHGTRSGCGHAASAMGPFYCPADEKVYIDLGFYQELKTRFGAPGDFAQAYVIAHEVGHHVQNLLGIDARMRREQQAHPREANALSVRLELQADCFAGIWARSTSQRHLLDPGDIESALGAAAAVGDDRLQKAATGHVTPETWTHGSSQQRVSWFRRGFDQGTVAACDTFVTQR